MGCSSRPSPPAGEVLKLLAMSTGLAYFIGLILFDAWRSLASKPRIHWIPARALILTALTLQILSYVDHKNVSIYDEPNYDEAMQLIDNQLVMDSGRLVMCVFIGYLLPRMAASGSATRWGDIAALNVSVFIAIVSELYYVRHSAPQDSSNGSEKFYYEHASPVIRRTPAGHDRDHEAQTVESYQFFWAASHSKSQKLWFAASSIVVLVATVTLILLLMSSVLAGKTVRDLVSPRILSIIESPRVKSSRDESGRVESSRDESGEAESSPWDVFDEQIMRSWLLSRVGQPQYAISRSVLSSLAGLLVTVCVVLLVVKAIVMKSKTIIVYKDCWDWLRYATFSLQCLFVLLGWVVILWRWFCGVVYFPKFSSPPKKSVGQIRGPRWSMEDFWRRSIYEMRDLFELRDWQPTLDRNKKLWAATKSAAKKCEICLPVHFLLAIQTSVVFFSKCCSFLSEKVFCSTLVRRCLVQPNKDDGHQQFKKYEEALEHVCMPGENAEDLWLANKRIFNEAKHRLEKGQDKGKGFEELKTLLNQHFDSGVSHESRFVNKLESLQLVNDYFPFLNENSWKISAVSLLKIINTVFPSDMPTALEAYRQAWKLMTFVERSHAELPCSDYTVEVLDVEVDRVSLAADKEYKRLLRLRDPSLKKDSDLSLKKDNHETGREALDRLMKEAEEQLKDQNLIPPSAEELQQIPPGKDEEKGEIQQIPETKGEEAGGSQQVSKGKDEEEHSEHPHHHHHHLHLQDSKDWNAVASSYNMYRVCKAVLSSIGSDSDEMALVRELQMSLANVIGHCLLQLPEALAWQCTLWTVKYEEGRIWEAISIAGKLRGIMEGKWTSLVKEIEISKFKWTLEEREVQHA